jgi:hypothetical protein
VKLWTRYNNNSIFSITLHTFGIHLSGCAKINKLLKATKKNVTATVECELAAARLIV